MWQVATADPRILDPNSNVVAVTNLVMAALRVAARRSLLTAVRQDTGVAATRGRTDNARLEAMMAGITSASRNGDRKPTARVMTIEAIEVNTEGSVTKSVVDIGQAGIQKITIGTRETEDGSAVTGVRRDLGTERWETGTARRDTARKVILLHIAAVATEVRATSMVARVTTAVGKVKVDMVDPLVSRTFPSAKRIVTMVTTSTTTAMTRTLIRLAPSSGSRNDEVYAYAFVKWATIIVVSAHGPHSILVELSSRAKDTQLLAGAPKRHPALGRRGDLRQRLVGLHSTTVLLTFSSIALKESHSFPLPLAVEDNPIEKLQCRHLSVCG